MRHSLPVQAPTTAAIYRERRKHPSYRAGARLTDSRARQRRDLPAAEVEVYDPRVRLTGGTVPLGAALVGHVALHAVSRRRSRARRLLGEGEHLAVVADQVAARLLRVLGPRGTVVVLHAVYHARLWRGGVVREREGSAVGG